MISPEGKIILIPAILVVAGLGIIQYHYPSAWIRVLLGLGVIFLVFSLYFFRDPRRDLPEGSGYFISPADGKVVKILQVEDEHLGVATQISIFLSVFNVHSQRVPTDAKVIEAHYNPGKFLAAYNHKASLDNEQTRIRFETTEGKQYKIKQIAGLIARRILCYMEPGMSVKQGDRLGFIRFGSRVDILVPEGFTLQVKLGDIVKGNQTIIGHF